jgi:hypothetical protein
MDDEVIIIIILIMIYIFKARQRPEDLGGAAAPVLVMMVSS